MNTTTDKLPSQVGAMNLILIALAKDAAGFDAIRTQLTAIGAVKCIAEAPVIVIPTNIGEAMVFADQVKPILSNLSQYGLRFAAMLYEVELPKSQTT